ncbi:PACE efflux transporter [Pseudomonas typographi]|uniref:PACE efflux transporter n=1 Tax=Pseudomonas typographi TaxID=2715964 RepID=A0ABR7Z3X7_9PSED|nr:PACE efflux transporter [Pseudomonas typographi]MBD1552652.1 PACE efflux transporter [Pseudomonas typographi]MBD1588133.1 PACE efflux transporter [Pseudomonas typographi]MBD1600104.1 PACE efflux transporter [Pseudomonas typographi]
MQGVKRKVVYVSLYEGIAIAFNSVAIGWLGHDLGHAGAAAVLASVVAIAWNLGWNSLFEAWEARQRSRRRTVTRRLLHALGFEGGLVVVLVPMFAWWLGISLLEALWLDLGLLAFFLVYTYAFNWAFDAVFGLPRSAHSAAT